MVKFVSVRGTRDIFLHEVKKLRYIERCCREVVSKYNFQEIILPTFEDKQLYQRSIGETTDIVEKQMYEIVDTKGRKFVLRPEGTAGVVRAYIEHNLKNIFPLKRFFYFGPMYRYERPQKGRYREFYQFGIEIFNEPSPSSDILLIKIILEVFNKVGINGVLYINSVGCDRCRPQYTTELVKYLNSIKQSLCNDCKIRLQRNPLRILDCKIDTDKIVNIPQITNYLCEQCKTNYEEIKQLLNKQNIEYKEDKFLVRGLDYYTNFVFEYKVHSLSSTQNTICAGGRYDTLIKTFGAEDTLACGCAFGIDRMMELVTIPKGSKTDIIKIGIGTVSDEYVSKGFEIADMLTQNNSKYIVIGPLCKKSLKSQLRLFNNEQCKYVVIIGEEITQNKVVLKDFSNNRQEVVEINFLVEKINKIE